MRPLTLQTPKPLLPVAGRTLLDRILDRLREVGTQRVVINAWYLADQISLHAGTYAGDPTLSVAVSREPDTGRLETAGAAVWARDLLGEGPFLAINGDSLWLDGPSGSALRRLVDAFDPERMDALLLLLPRLGADHLPGPGDFDLLTDGRLHRRQGQQPVSHWYIGAQMVSPRLLAGLEKGQRESFNPCWDRALAAGRLFGLEHDGQWYHVGTPEDLAQTEAALQG